MSEPYCYRRYLPHWRLDGATYFVTWRLLPNQAELSGPERDIVVSVLKHFEDIRYGLPGYVVMNDHVHALVEPFQERRLEQVLCSWKSYSTKLLMKAGTRGNRVWQHESFDRIVRNEDELKQKIAYMQANPFKRWPTLSTYPWFSPQ